MTTPLAEQETAPAPHDLAAEKGVLGAILLSGEHDVLLRVAAAGLGPDDFYRAAHGDLWRHLLGMFGRDEPVDTLTVKASLERAGWPAGMNALYLHGLIEAVPTVANAAHYARIVHELGQHRRSIEEAISTLQRLADLKDPSKLDEAFAEIAANFEGLRKQTPAAAVRPAWADRLAAGGLVLDAPADPPAIWGEGDRVYWAEGESLIIAGPPGVGKTTLAGQLVAGRLGLGGRNLLGMQVKPGARKVLYLAMDRPQQMLRALRRLFGPADRDALDNRLVVWQGPPPGDFAANPNLLAEMCDAAGADTVVVDSIKDCVAKVSEDASGNGYNQARQRALAAGVQVVELHHQRKSSSENRAPKKLDDIYGSVWITAGAGSVVILWGEGGDPVVELIHVKGPAGTLDPVKVSHDFETGLSSLVDEIDLYAACPAWNPSSGSGTGLTAPEAAGKLYDSQAPSRAQVQKARRRLDRMVKDGLLTARTGHRGGQGGGEATRYYRAERTAPAVHGGDYGPDPP